MARKDTLEFQMTKAEVKALLRLLEPSIAIIRSDPTVVSNEITLQRSIDTVERVAEKIKSEMVKAGFQ